MTDDRMEREPDLRVEMVDDEIIVSLSGWYSVTYYKPNRMRQLLAKRISERDYPRAPMRLTEFLSTA